MRKQTDSLDRRVQLILAKDLGDPDELKPDEKSSDDDNGLSTVKEDELSSAEEGTLLKVSNPVALVAMLSVVAKLTPNNKLSHNRHIMIY